MLITGASGQVGRALVGSVPANVELQALTRAELDIANADAVRTTLQASRPPISSSMRQPIPRVDKAKRNRSSPWPGNFQGPRNLAQSVRAVPGCRLLHISTDYVFDGSSIAALQAEATLPIPLSVYGRSKLLGETVVLEILGSRAGRAAYRVGVCAAGEELFAHHAPAHE